MKTTSKAKCIELVKRWEVLEVGVFAKFEIRTFCSRVVFIHTDHVFLNDPLQWKKRRCLRTVS